MKQTAAYYIPSYDDLISKIQELDARISQLEQKNAPAISEQPLIVENLYVRRMYTKKLQFNLDTIDVQELSGMLNIGINKGGKFKKKEINRTGNCEDPEVDESEEYPPVDGDPDACS